MASDLYPGVTGFLTPIFSEETGNGQMNHGLGPTDFQRVVEGYACGNCLASFSTYRPICPVCGLERDMARDATDNAPALWTDHLKERHREDAPATPIRTIDDFLADVQGDGDIEKIQLSKMRRRRR